MKWLIVFLFGICVKCAKTNSDGNFVFTYAMATHCKEHISQRGYSYDEFYSANAEDSKVKSSSSVAFEMHIAIQAVSNGHILLSEVPFPSQNDSVYEIVVGGGGNKFTELRRNLKRNAKASLATISILSAVELRGFYVIITRSGLVKFGKEGSDLPILSYLDISPLDIKYFSFAAWNGVEAKFLYDCPSSKEMPNATLPDSKVIKRNLTSSELLKKDLLRGRPSYLAPAPIIPVNLGVYINGVTYDAFTSKLTTRMSIVTSWNDESLAWNPTKYNQLTSVTYRQGEIWRPTLHIYNSDSFDALRPSGHEIITMNFSGAATFHFKAVVDTWCYSKSLGFNKWPRDEYICTIMIQPWQAHENIKLTAIYEVDRILEHFPDTDEITINEWSINDWKQLVITSSEWNELFSSLNNNTHKGDKLAIELHIGREAASYNLVFYTPLIVLMVLVIISFWSKPLQLSRVWFYNGCSIIICMGLCSLDKLIPWHTVPSIMVLYITVLGGVLLAMVLNIFMMTSIAERLCKTQLIQNLLMMKWFRLVFCLPVLLVCTKYNNMNESMPQEEDDSGVMVASSNGNIEEMVNDTTNYCEKEEMAEVVDRILFLVYSIVFAVMLGLHF